MRYSCSSPKQRAIVSACGPQARMNMLRFVGHGFSRADTVPPIQGFQLRKFVFVAGMLLLSSALAWAQSSTYKGVGRAPTEDEVRALDVAVGPSGKELPPGSGTAKDGEDIFANKCALCHGVDGEGSSLAPRLVGGQETLKSPKPVLTIGSYWPFATTIFDYVRKTMPRGQEGSLSANELYALSAFLLFKNGIIKDTDVMDAKTLPKVQMPNRNGFVPQQLDEIHNIKKRGCRLGHCP
jgi:cytochrome c